jgi:CheY-like chemotaxis protein
LCQDDAPKQSLLEANLGELLAAAKRAGDLVRQILTFARQSDQRLSPVIVGPIAKQALKLIRATIPSSIQIRPSITSNAAILTNPTQVHQILMNLCSNAAHAMEPAGGILTVTLADRHVAENDPQAQFNLDPGDYVLLEVSDTGAGIAPENIPSIFEPYFTTKPPGEGTGMGLSVVHGIVEKCGGKTEVQSRVGQGTTFAIHFPVSGESQDRIQTAKDGLPTGNESVLVVDDEPSVVNAIDQILKRLGYTVTSQTNPMTALDLFRHRPDDYDIVITDMTMPKMNGHQLAVEILHLRPDIPVILCTGFSKLVTDETALQLGVKAFAYKPIVKKELARTVRDALDGRVRKAGG